MATAGTIKVRVTVQDDYSPAIKALPWHRDTLRCRLAQAIYRFSRVWVRLADRIDHPDRHRP
jgi:hypothetical protein